MNNVILPTSRRCIGPTKLLFLCAIDRQTNDFCTDPQKFIQLPYLELTNLDDFCNMNGYYPIDNRDDIQTDAYQKTVNRPMIPDDIDNRLYQKHVIGNDDYFICLIEIKLDYLSMLFQRKLQIPNRNFFFKLCTVHHKLMFNEYFLSMFYTHVMSERLTHTDINKNMDSNDIKQRIMDFFQYTEHNSNVSVYHNKILPFNERHSIHIPVGDTTGGQFVKTNNSQYNLNLNGSILLADHGIQNKTIVIDYIYQQPKPIVNPKDMVAKSSLVITSENRLFGWKEYAMSVGARTTVITSIDDLLCMTYEYLLYVDFVIVTSDLVESKEYQKLVSEYKIANLSYLHAVSVMREEYKKINKVLEEISPVLSLITWNKVVYDNINLKDHSDLYFSFVCQHKVILGEPSMSSAESGIKLLFGYPSMLQRNLLTQAKVQQIVVDQIMVITRHSINPTLLPTIVNRTINFHWTYPEEFFISYFKDTLKYNLARRLDIIPTNSFVDHVNHINSIEEVKGLIDDHYRKKNEAIEETLYEMETDRDTMECEFAERGIICNPEQLHIGVSDGNMTRHDFLDIFEIIDKYLHYQTEISKIRKKLDRLLLQWDFVFQQADLLQTEKSCGICYESLDYKNIGFSVTCGHIYCYRCLQQHRQSQVRVVKSCPCCRQVMEMRTVIIYHRHPVQVYDIPNYNTKLNILKQLIESTDGSYLLYVPQVNDSDLRIIQREMAMSGLSCVIYEGNIYERYRIIKMFQENNHRVLIISEPIDFTLHTDNVILLRSNIETYTLNSTSKIPVWDQIRGSFEALDQQHHSINVYQFNLLENDVL